MTHPEPKPAGANPLLQEWTTPYGLPPFQQVRPEHFEPAFEVAMQAQMAEIDAIANQAQPPSFENTVAALDRCGRLFSRIDLLFGNLTVSETSPALQAVEREMAPRLAAHENAIYLHAGLFERIAALHAQRHALGLDDESLRCWSASTSTSCSPAPNCRPQARRRYGEITEELAAAHDPLPAKPAGRRSRLAAELKGEADLAGLPEFVRSAARSAARQRGLGPDAHAITLSPSLAEPFLTFSARRDLREAVWRARIERGAHEGEHDNRAIAGRIIALRQEQAALHGYDSYADYALADRMAQRHGSGAGPAGQSLGAGQAKADDDRALLTAMARRLGEPTPIAAWDWRYLAEKVRQQAVRPGRRAAQALFRPGSMIAAMFDCAGRLFGLKFVEQPNPALYHPDVRLWEVRDRGDALVGIFLGDNFARPSKRSGAWMSIFRSQSGIDGGTLPIVINNNNFAKASPTLLSFEDVRTLFHEFGHGLHGLLSQVRYERLAGTRVLRDFVELPSQLFENWALEPQILQRHARHCETGEPIPQALLDKLAAARRFDQAWATIQYTGPALIDMALHSLPAGTVRGHRAVRGAAARRAGRARGHRPAPPPAAFPAPVRRLRLRGRLLRVHVGGGAGGGCVRRVRRSRRPVPRRNGRALAQPHLQRRRPPRAGPSVPQFQGARPGGRTDAAQARFDRLPGRNLRAPRVASSIRRCGSAPRARWHRRPDCP